VPLAPIQALLAAIEPLTRPLMPVTAGQLSVFGNDSVPSANWLQSRLQAGMPSTEETIADLVYSANTGSGGGASGAPRRERPARPISEDVARGLKEECRLLTAYLVGMPSSPYIEERYARAAHVHGLAFDEDFSCFDRATIGLVRSGRVLARCADAYCAIFHRRGALRRKLTVLAAVLEHAPPTSEAFDRVEPRHLALTVLSLAGHGSIAAAALLLGVVILTPAKLLCWLTTCSMRLGMRARQAP
jgi:hypothetical protein